MRGLAKPIDGLADANRNFLIAQRINRAECVNHAGAEVASFARNGMRRCDQHTAHIVRRELRIARQQKRRHTAGMRGSNCLT